MASIFSSILGIGESAPRVAPTGTVVTEEKLATEIAPFYKDLLAKSQALHDSRMEEGYQPYQGQTVADLTQDELTAREGIRGLVGSQQADYDEARRLYGLQTEKFTADTAQEYLNPYQQAVTDVALRKAEEDFSRRVMPKFEKFASDAGGMSGLGTRAGVQAGSLGEAFMQNLSDIQTKGSAAAFDAGRAAFEAQKRREGMTAERLPALAGQEYGTRARELAGLTAIGEDERARIQTSLDENYKDFLEERRFPEEQLQRYQSTIQGFPNLKNEIVTTSARQPTGMQQFLSTASGLGSLYGSFGGFSPGGFGSAYTPTGTSPKPKAAGGQVRRLAGGGLAGLPVVTAQEGTNDGLIGDRSPIMRFLQSIGGPAVAEAEARRRAIPVTAVIREGLRNLARNPEQQIDPTNPEQVYDPSIRPSLNIGMIPSAQAATRARPTTLSPSVSSVEQFSNEMEPGSPDSGISIKDLPALEATREATREAIRTAEVLNPGLRRDPNSPTGFNLKDDRIEAGSAGMGEADMYGTLPKGSSVRPPEPTVSDAQKLYDLIIKQAADRKSALEGAKKSKSERNAERKEQARISDLVQTLGRFSQNILDPESNIGSAFGKTTTQMAASRQAEADRQAAVGDTIDDLNAKIAIAAADGDVAALTALIKAKSDAEEIRLKGLTAKAAISKALSAADKARFDKYIALNNLNNDQAEILEKAAILQAKGETNKEALTDMLQTAFRSDLKQLKLVPDHVKEIMRITQSARQAVDPEPGRP